MQPLDKQLAIVYRSGISSLRAAGFLMCNGYDPENVVNMKHGIIRWAHKGFPTKGMLYAAGLSPASVDYCSSDAGKLLARN